MLSDEDKKCIRYLVQQIQENLRAGKSAGLDYIDLKDHRSQVLAKQNHVIFGRRGAGKSTLIRALRSEAEKARTAVVETNMEDFKDISFPDIIIQVLLRFVQECRPRFDMLSVRRFITIWQAKHAINKLSKHLIQLRNDPENYTSDERRLVKSSNKAGASIQSINTEVSSTSEDEFKRSVPISKLGILRKELPDLKETFGLIIKALNVDAIFLVFDDFYFIEKDIQPDFIDYFHRLSKDTGLFIKIATIKYRSKLYTTTSGGQAIGVEVNHDILPIDLDYTLDNFNGLKQFMMQLTEHLAKRAEKDLQWIENLFQGDGFAQLCLASGGVPRDFLALLVSLLTRLVNGGIERIGKIEVNEAAIDNANDKRQAFQSDSAGERDILHNYLLWIKEQVITNSRCNTFLIAKPDLDRHNQQKQAIRELTDLRFIHLVDSNISSAPSDGRRYEAYMVDVGLYDNARPRNFEQIDPAERDDRSRRDKLRASPRLSLVDMAKATEYGDELVLTTD